MASRFTLEGYLIFVGYGLLILLLAAAGCAGGYIAGFALITDDQTYIGLSFFLICIGAIAGPQVAMRGRDVLRYVEKYHVNQLYESNRR